MLVTIDVREAPGQEHTGIRPRTIPGIPEVVTMVHLHLGRIIDGTIEWVIDSTGRISDSRVAGYEYHRDLILTLFGTDKQGWSRDDSELLRTGRVHYSRNISFD